MTAALTPDALATVDETFHRRLATTRVPGAAWGVVAGGGLVHAGGAGVTSVDGPPAVPGPRTLFRIASMTKSFTAAAVLALRDDGALALDDPIGARLPAAAALRGPTADSPAITDRHLLSMDSGLPTDDPWADRHLDLPDAELDRLVAGGAWFAWPTGTATQYSNLGYALLGRLVSRTAGRPCQEVIAERFLRPLGLTDTVWEPRADRVDRAIGHRLADDAWHVDRPDPLGDGAFAPMGGLWSTVADMARWVAFFLDAYPARDDPDDAPLGRATRREMQRAWRADAFEAAPCRQCDAVRARSDGYAAGLRAIHDAHVGTVVSHSGGLPGFGSNMQWLPDRDLGLVSFGNLSYAAMAATNRAVVDALHHRGQLPERRPQPVPSPLADAARALMALLNDWDDGRAGALFADNVALDEPFERRKLAAAALVAGVGRLDVVDVRADNRADATITASGERGGATILMQLHPLLPPRIQWYEATVDAAD